MAAGANQTAPLPPKLVLATHNQGKLRELRAMLAAAGVQNTEQLVVDAGAVGAPDVVETGVSFEANSRLKAEAVAAHTGIAALADDSGLCVDVLGGAPGIFSARWAGSHGDDAANLRLLLAQLGDIAPEHRGAQFRSAVTLAVPGQDGKVDVTVTEGSMPGRLAYAPAGEGGFGYDPIFLPEGMDVTAAQLSAEQKNAISHRGKAIEAMLPHLLPLFG